MIYWPILAIAVVTAVLCLPGLWWHDRGELERRDASLALPGVWLFVASRFMPASVLWGTRQGFPLRDGFLAAMDRALGVNVPAVAVWIQLHPHLAAVSAWVYHSLYYLLPAAVFLPALAGRKRAAWRFLVSNVIAFVAAIPLFTLFPAIGPWVGQSAFVPNAEQFASEASVYALHAGQAGTAVHLVCLPSFHVVWALLSAAALWSIRPLRIPASTLAALIVLSTLTTGWHYFADVVAGIVFAAAAWRLATNLLQEKCDGISIPAKASRACAVGD